MKPTLQPIRPKRISDQVYDQLCALVMRGDLTPGDKLMPERELATTLGVSRTTVREAINKMVVMGLVEQKQGNGTFVCQRQAMEDNPLAAILGTKDATLEDLLDVRLGIECNSVFWAAQRAVPTDRTRLTDCIEKMAKEGQQGQIKVRTDIDFHMALAMASKNPVQVYLMKNFQELLSYSIETNLAFLYATRSYVEAVHQQHAQIAEAVCRSDARKAVMAMKTHIEYIKSQMPTITTEPSSTVYSSASSMSSGS